MKKTEEHHLPGVDGAGLGERDGELRSAFDFDDSHAVQRLNTYGHLTAIAASTTQLAIVTVTPRPDVTVVSDAQSLGVTATACHVHYTTAFQRIHLHTYRQKIIYTFFSKHFVLVTCTQTRVSVLF